MVVENATTDVAEDLLPTGPDCAGITTAHHDLTYLVDHPLPPPVLHQAVAATGGLPLAATLTAAVLTHNPHARLFQVEQEPVMSPSAVPARVNQILTQLNDQAATAATLLLVRPVGPRSSNASSPRSPPTKEACLRPWTCGQMPTALCSN